MEENKYLTPEEAADMINENYTASSKYAVMYVNAKKGNFKPVFPELAIVENGKIVQNIGKSKSRFFLSSEIELYARKKQNETSKNPHQIGFVVTFEDGTEQEFKNIAIASNALNIEYQRLQRALKSGKDIDGYKLKKL